MILNGVQGLCMSLCLGITGVDTTGTKLFTKYIF